MNGSSRSLLKHGGAFLLAAVTLTTSHRAAAQTSDAALAESLFLEGRKLIAAGDVAAACPKFRQSHELDPQLGTLLNLGKCYEQNGQTASAWAAFTELSRLASRAGQKARADFAAERVAALESDLAYVTVRLAPPLPEGIVVSIDDKSLTPAVLGTALRLDPGQRQLTVQAPGFQPFTRTIDVSHGSRQEVVVPALSPVVVESPPPPPPPVPDPVLVPRPLPPPAPWPRPDATPVPSPWWPAAIGGYAVTGVGLVVGGITGGFALDAGGSLDCPMDACNPADEDTLSRATTLANVSNVSFAVAGAGAIFSIVATVLAVRDEKVEVSSRGVTLRF